MEDSGSASDPVIIPSHGPPLSPGRRFFERLSSQTKESSASSELLNSIKAALQGSGEELNAPIQTSVFSSDELGIEEELAWDQHTVVWSTGGNQKCKWNLEEEGQCIQWACVGWLLRSGVMNGGSSNSAARYTSDKKNEPSSSSSSTGERDTFSPFTRARQSRQKISEPTTVSRAVFVFLRSFGKVYLSDGIDYTFSLPFIVRKAWPLYPHGVLLQRVLDRVEIEEAEITGDFTLPTLFTITNPFSEPRAVGLTDGIKGGFGIYKTVLKDGEGTHAKPLKSIPADEHVIYVSERLSGATDDIIVTINADMRQISIWHYVYITPKDIPIPLGQKRARSLSRRRTSVSGKTSNELRQAGSSQTLSDRAERIAPLSPDPLDIPRIDLADFPPLSAIPGLPTSMTSMTTAATLTSLTSTTSMSMSSQWSANSSGRGRRNSLTRNELSVTMDKMALGKRPDSDISFATVEHGRMTPAYWAEKLYHYELSDSDKSRWRDVSVSCFDQRYDGEADRSYIALCLPASQKLIILKLTREKNTTQTISFLTEMSAVSATALRATRNIAWDLLLVKPNGALVLLMHGLYELPIRIADRKDVESYQMHVDGENSTITLGKKDIAITTCDSVLNAVTIGYEDGSEIRTTLSLFPPDVLTNCCLCALGATLPADIFFLLHKKFLQLWSRRNLDSSHNVEFDCFEEALADTLQIDESANSGYPKEPILPWQKLQLSRSYSRLRDDTALFNLRLPSLPKQRLRPKRSPHRKLFTPTMLALHTLAENLRLQLHFHKDLLRLAPIICRLARCIRPSWAEYWHRLCSDIDASWRANPPDKEDIDESISYWPPDISACLLTKLAHPELPADMTDVLNVAPPYSLIKPSFAFGRTDPFACLHEVTAVYSDLANIQINEARKRAENAIVHMVRFHRTYAQLSLLAMGIATPFREAARTCQLFPPPEWPLAAYEFIGRNDLSEGAVAMNDQIFNDGYITAKEHISKKGPRKSYSEVFDQTHRAVHGDHDGVTGVELDLENFTDIRFGQDRRLYEVARILSSASVTQVKMLERPELSEHDVAKEHQAHVSRTAERTLSLPLGRAIFTYGSLPSVSREVYVIPKINLSIRLQPQNTVVTPEPGKISADSMSWADFHNGVAAGLRISPSSRSIDSSWIAFNKPQELSPEHAGFLYGLGLNGHLKEMLTWHTFSYLTPKHDLTSIGVLLGLSAANVGTGNRHVTKLIAVHTPALLPTPAVDLNVPLLTQAAGLIGIGLLYMGTKNRRMAEMALHQISRKDLLQPDLSNEHREAYTIAAALSFGMVMLGKGATMSSPVDLALLSRLRVLIHGEGPSTSKNYQGPSFDVNLTSPAASIALGLMYLRTERKDIADILSIPNTILALNHVQPSFLLIRTLARALIMWEGIKPSIEWLISQIPLSITQAMEARQRGQPIDDSIELAYYHIVSGGCMAVGLKYAGTASHDAYLFIINSYDLFVRFAHTPGPAFDQKIKRSAVRDGINTISLALNMVMAGTAEINCLRRLRFAHGMNGPVRYGSHMATHMSLGLLFLGVGRYTLGTSDAAIACMITAFYPRFPILSSDNKCYLQALRHLWVLAVEPRCLIARDVDTKEIVYLPMKIRVKEDNAGSTGTQLISPSLIPGLDRLVAIKVDTPRYWPFYLDIANIPRHREALLRSQTLLVKRHCAFLSYLEDPKGSRSLFVRSGSSTSNAAALDFPQFTDIRAHPAGDLEDFITSASNDILFTAFADRYCSKFGETEDEKTFNSFCHAALLDSILQGKPQTLQTHLLLHRARVMSPKSRYFNLMLQDLRFMAEFYNKVYERRMSGRWDNPNGGGVTRPPLLRESTVLGVLHSIDEKLNVVRQKPSFKKALKSYITRRDMNSQHPGGENEAGDSTETVRELAWYLIRENMPDADWLGSVLALGRRAWLRSLNTLPPHGVKGSIVFERERLMHGIKLLMQNTGSSQATFLIGNGWSFRSFEDVLGIVDDRHVGVDDEEDADISHYAVFTASNYADGGGEM